jgi:hypothetical protein
MFLLILWRWGSRRFELRVCGILSTWYT